MGLAGLCGGGYPCCTLIMQYREGCGCRIYLLWGLPSGTALTLQGLTTGG